MGTDIEKLTNQCGALEEQIRLLQKIARKIRNGRTRKQDDLCPTLVATTAERTNLLNKLAALNSLTKYLSLTLHTAYETGENPRAPEKSGVHQNLLIYGETL